ncbi:MAG: hypothetical protein ACOWW1_01435 [archaeon]|nr:hypothetical protein [Candidatus Bathyarchaeum sp.]
MVNITIEYVIMIPLLFSTVIVFPLVANRITTETQEAQLRIELQDVADHMASTIQQLYLSVNSEEILTGTVTQESPVPVTVAFYPYTVEGSLYDPGDGSAKVFTAFLTLDDVGNTVTASAVLGTNVQWVDSSFRSTSVDASIMVQKLDDADHTIVFSFGGS